MRSKGSRFTLGVWGLRVCSLDVAFTTATIRHRPQPFATVRNRPREGRMAVPMVSFAKGVIFGGFKRCVASFRVAGVALRDIQACFVTCGKSFCVAGAILLRRFQKTRCMFLAGAALWRPPSSFCVASAALDVSHCVLYTPHSTLHTPHFTLNTLHFTFHIIPHFTLHFTLYTLHSTLYTPHSTLHTPHFTLHTPHFTIFTLHTPHFTLRTSPSTLHTLHFTLHTQHFTLHTPHSTLYTPHSTLCTPPSSAFHSLQCTGMVTGENVDWSNNLFHKSVLRDCIRVGGLHLALSCFITECVFLRFFGI